MIIQPCLPFLIQMSNISLKGYAHFCKRIKKANRTYFFKSRQSGKYSQFRSNENMPWTVIRQQSVLI